LQEPDCVSAAGATSIAESQTLTSLKVLNFDSHYLGDAGLRELARSPNSNQLVELDLSYNNIDMQGWLNNEEGAVCREWLKLRRLKLTGNYITYPAAFDLVRWSRVPKMEWIDLRQTTLDPLVRDALEASPYAAKFLLDDPAAEYA